MGNQTSIEWTDSTWNPWQGCHHVSPGCEQCYMFSEKRRYGQDPDVVVRSKPTTFNLPLRLRQRQRVFTCSWSDFFIKEADPWREEAWEIIRNTPHLTYQILTKRIERAAERLPWGEGEPWPNVWLGVSAEDQPTARRRIPLLCSIRAAVRFVSFEPLLGPIELISASGTLWPYLHWAIIGGESGSGARPCNLAWIRSLKEQCQEWKVPVFCKQGGSSNRCAHDSKGGCWECMPADLKIREYPR